MTTPTRPKGRPRRPSSDKGWVYVQQGIITFDIKVGYAGAYRLAGRQQDHTTRGGPQREIGWAPSPDDRSVERAAFALLDEWRVVEPVEFGREREYEIFHGTPECIATVMSPEFAALGFSIMRRPVDVRSVTAKQWLSLVARHRKGRTRDAAIHNLTEEHRLRSVVPRSARGGWDLSESIGHPGQVWRQQAFEMVSELRVTDGWLVNVVRYRGSEFRFAVFAEWYERETGRKAPAEAFRGGLPVRPKLASGRAGDGRRVVRAPALVMPCDRQEPLFGNVAT